MDLKSMKKEPKDVIIYLNIDTEILAKPECATQSDVDRACVISDTVYEASNLRPEDFVSTVYKGKKVTWKGHCYNQSFKAAITGVIYEGGAELFKNDLPFYGNGKNDSFIEEKLKDDSALVGKTETYTIYFSISNNLKTWGPFTIDPKLKMSATD